LLQAVPDAIEMTVILLRRQDGCDILHGKWRGLIGIDARGQYDRSGISYVGPGDSG
jgi:hypothetical protein